MTSTEHKANCFCGAIEFTVSGNPEGMGFCHCDSCRRWSAAPINGFTLWAPASVEITKGVEFLGEYHKTEHSHRKFCTECGGHLMTEHPGMGLVDVYAALLPGLEFRPGLHVHYQEKVLSIPDGLPKFADMPSDFGGTGQELPE